MFNPWRMCEGYGSHCVVCVCVCVTTLAATYIMYLIYKSQVRYYKVPNGVSNVCIVWISLKMLCSPVLASFAYKRCLPCFLMRPQWTTVGPLHSRYVCTFSDSSYKTNADKSSVKY